MSACMYVCQDFKVILSPRVSRMSAARTGRGGFPVEGTRNAAYAYAPQNPPGGKADRPYVHCDEPARPLAKQHTPWPIEKACDL